MYQSELIHSPRGKCPSLPPTSHGVESVDCGSLLLDAPQFAAIENAISNAQVSKDRDAMLTSCHIGPKELELKLRILSIVARTPQSAKFWLLWLRFHPQTQSFIILL